MADESFARGSARAAAGEAIDLTDELLRGWPLPMPADGGDKEDRGHLLIVAGSREMPGAAILAATAALRAGAGKLVIGTPAGAAQAIALAIPESRVIALKETDEGGIAPDAVEAFGKVLDRVDAVLVGPGMQDEASVCDFVRALVPRLGRAQVVLDACAMAAVTAACDLRTPKRGGKKSSVPAWPTLVTPHAGEMAHLTGKSKEDIERDPDGMALDAASKWNATVVLKGSTTFIASPDGRLWSNDRGNPGLAISGSGDALAGIIAGLAARGAPLEQAAAWGVALHARAGERLADRIGPLGYLARELAGEIPSLMRALGRT